MELALPSQPSAHQAAVQVVLQQAEAPPASLTVKRDQKALLLTSDGQGIDQVNAVCQALCRELCPHMLGGTDEEQAQVQQWLAFVHTQLTPLMDDSLAEVNTWLATRTFLVGTTATLADLVLYAALSPAITKFPKAQQSVFCHLLRWYDHVHHTLDARRARREEAQPICAAVSLPPVQPPRMPSAAAPAPRGAAAPAGVAAVAPAPAAKGGQGTLAAAAASGEAALAAASPAKSSAGAPPDAGAGSGKSKKEVDPKKAERAAKNAAKQAPAAAAKAAAGVDALDVRVGTITQVERHPDADGLYLEQIDVGEAAPRQVISGLVKWVAEGDMAGRRVAVVCNLKPAKMRGVMSHGMVLCASTEAAVEPVAVPEGVPNGERVMVEGYDAAPEEQLNPKKKVLEALLPDMATDAEGVAGYKGTPFNTPKGPLTSKIANAPVK